MMCSCLFVRHSPQHQCRSITKLVVSWIKYSIFSVSPINVAAHRYRWAEGCVGPRLLDTSHMGTSASLLPSAQTPEAPRRGACSCTDWQAFAEVMCLTCFLRITKCKGSLNLSSQSLRGQEMSCVGEAGKGGSHALPSRDRAQSCSPCLQKSKDRHTCTDGM